jgi:hypothetical protein
MWGFEIFAEMLGLNELMTLLKISNSKCPRAMWRSEVHWYLLSNR